MRTRNNDLAPDLAAILHRVEKPGRYTGGEYGSVVKDDPAALRIALSYPDLYEIGMSNLAIRLLYRRLNALPGVACERVFAPALDFEAELRGARLPLGSLETRTPLRDFDVVGFSVGYELTLTNLLAILDLGGIGLLAADRGSEQPIVLGGGPALTNPAPFGPFLDGVFIGEFEEVDDVLIPGLRDLKCRGASRQDRLEFLRSQPAVWYAGRTSKARRAIWRGFGIPEGDNAGTPHRGSPFPIPNIAAVQDHGVVEIMRGCPNGCRFCHAGILYRPFRQKDPAVVLREVEEQVFACGYREVTLSSLSSGDYPGLTPLVGGLTRYLAPHRVSFSLPSLRVNSLTLDLLSEISAVRKSGLTFAVETPLPAWQRGLNKEVPLERTVALLEEAKSRGWRLAKFYFMVGLPVSCGEDESGPIVEFLEEVRRRVHLTINANVSAFIPKAHTPFQWASQLQEQEALERIMRVKHALARKGVTVRYHAPFLSLLEGILSRGEERAGLLFLEAYRRGARFDSWEDLVQRPLWRAVLSESGWGVEAETCRLRREDEVFAWEGVSLGVSRSFLRSEYERSLSGERTDACCADCRENCGVCGSNTTVRSIDTAGHAPVERLIEEGPPERTSGRHGRVMFSFTKQGLAVFLSHLNVMQIFERALLRAGYAAVFTEGFNPKPRLEFAQPLSLGVASVGEIGLVELENFDGENRFAERLNETLPHGIRVERVRCLPPYEVGQKKRSLMSMYWGADYSVEAATEQRPGLEETLGTWSAQRPEAGCSIERSGRQVRIRVPASIKGAGNIPKLLDHLGFAEALSRGITVCRETLYAASLAGPEQPPVAYFDLEDF